MGRASNAKSAFYFRLFNCKQIYSLDSLTFLILVPLIVSWFLEGFWTTSSLQMLFICCKSKSLYLVIANSSQTYSPNILCGWSFISRGPPSGVRTAWNYISWFLKLPLEITGANHGLITEKQYGAKYSTPTLRVQMCLDWFSWGHQVLSNNHLSAVLYRGMFIYCQMYIVWTLTTHANLLWPPVFLSTSGPNSYLLYTSLFSAAVYGGCFVLIS